MESYQCTRKKDTRKQKKLVRRFSKKWVPSVAMGDPEESGMIERCCGWHSRVFPDFVGFRRALVAVPAGGNVLHVRINHATGLVEQ